jgi:hypothetical protein
MFADSIMFIAFVILVVCCVLGLWLHHRFLSALRERHSGIWKELGSPTLIANNSPQSFFAIRRFLRKMPALNISDPDLMRRGNALLFFQNFYFLLFAVVALLVLLNIITHR